MKPLRLAETILLIFTLLASSSGLIHFHVLAQPSGWPTSWIQFDWDKNENGWADDWRDVEYAYYQFDSNYLFLKFKCYGMPGSEWPHTGGRYKFFIDLDGDMYFSGGNVFQSEYLLFVEDTDEDGSGEQFLLFDTNNDGNYGEYEPWPPANYADYMITNPSVGGFRIVAVNQIEMYISWSAMGDPSSYWLGWATDQANPNLDQAPTTDRWDEEQPIVVHDVAAVNQTASPTVVTQGEVVSINVFVENQGTQSETFNVTCYCDSGIVGTQLVTSLLAGHSITLNFQWDTTGVPPRNYVIRAWADSGGVITETDETDNWCTSTTIVTVKIHDVAAISQVPNVTQVMRGGTVSIDVTVKNQGNFTETFDVTCYYDSNPIGTQLVTNLAPGVSTVKTFYWDTTGVALGTYHIRAWADSGNAILETDETNNNCTSFVTVTVYPPPEPGALFVDKAQTAVISGPNPPVVGFTTVYELTILVTNPGGSTVTNIVVNDTISSDVTFVSVGTPSQGSITATPPPKIVWNVGSLNAGASATLTFRVSVTPTTPGLLYLNHKEHLTASGIDSSTGNPVSDTGDTDVTVVAIARDVAAISQVPSNTVVLQGDSVAIYVTAQNQGTETETFNVTCYYSDGLTDTFIGRLRVYSLSAGDSIMLTFDWNTAGVAPGVYSIKAWADSGMEIAEGDEMDNWCTAPATVEIVIHDVAATSQTPNPTIVTQGESVTISVVVENQGSKPETFQVSCYYDSNPIGSPQTVTNLAPNASTTVVFIWDTTSVPLGIYYIYAVASTVPGEKDTNDNACYSVETVTVLTLQHLVVFAQTGLDNTATGIIVTVNGSGKIFAELPFSLLVDNGTTISYSYTSIVPSSVLGKRFNLTSVTGPSSPIFVTSAVNVTGNYVVQYEVTFDQTGIGTDFTGTVVTVDTTGYGVSGLPVSFWWDFNSVHSFSFATPLVVNASKEYYWISTSGLSTLQSGNLTVTTSGSVIGHYTALGKYQITFDQTGISSDFTGTVVTIDGTNYGVSALPVTFLWDASSVHNFNFQSPLVVAPNTKQYVWNSTSGLSTLRSDSITVTMSGNVIGHYKTQYYLIVNTNPAEVLTLNPAAVSGQGWYYSGSTATVDAVQNVDKVAGQSRYDFRSWTGATPTGLGNKATVLMDGPKTATANYQLQYKITFSQSGVGSDFTGPVVNVDSVGYGVSGLPISFWWDVNSIHNFDFKSPLVVSPNAKRYLWTSTGGLSLLQSGSITVTTSGNVIGNYKTQYYLTVNTDPAGITTISGTGWYDQGTIATTGTAPTTVTSGSTEYKFTTWKKDGTPVAGNPISVLMDAPHTATACYEKAPPPTVGGHAEFVAEVYSPTSELSFAKVLMLIILAIALVMSATLFKGRNKISVMRKIP